MKNGNKIHGLFMDTLKKTRIIGIIGIVLYVIGCFAVLTGVNIRDSSMPELCAAGSFNFGYLKSVVSFLPVPLVFVPIMMITAFHFVDKRSGSDFYFSMPVKRVGMYAQIMAAVLSRAVFMMLSAIITISLCNPFLKYVSMDFVGVLAGAAQTLASCIFMMGVFAIGISLTGNTASNIIASILVLTVPRAVTAVFAFFITLNIKFAEVCYVGDFLAKANTLNFTFEQIAGNVPDCIDIFPLIFTYAEGILYVVAGALLFRKRKSETAGRNSSSSGTHTVFGMAVPYILGLVGDGLLIWAVTDCMDYDMDEIIFFAVLMYVAAVLVYFIFELACSRKLRNTLKSAIKLPILAALVAVSFGGMYFFADRGNKYVPEEGKIDYVTIKTNLGIMDGPVTLHDKNAYKIICDAYTRQKTTRFEELPVISHCAYVQIGDGWPGHRRYVFFTDSEWVRLMRAGLESDAEFAYNFLPPQESKVFSMDYDMESMTGASAEKYYEMAYNELQENGKIIQSILDFSAGNGLVQVCAGAEKIPDGHYDNHLEQIYGSEDGISGIIYISKSTPETLGTILNEFSKKNPGINFSSAARKTDKQLQTFHLCLVDKDDKEYDEGRSLFTDEMSPEEINTLGAILDRYDNCGNPEADNTLFVRFEGFIGVYNLSEEDMNEIKRFIDDYCYY